MILITVSKPTVIQTLSQILPIKRQSQGISPDDKNICLVTDLQHALVMTIVYIPFQSLLICKINTQK